MENRFFEMSEYLEEVTSPDPSRPAPADSSRDSFNGVSMSQSLDWGRTMSVQNRVLIVLIENGGVDLGIPALVDKLLSALKVGAIIPDSVKSTLVDYLRKKITSFTDNLIETAELTINRYSAAKPDLFGNVVVLRNGTATYQELKEILVKCSKEQKIVDLFVLTHGSNDYIALSNGVGIDGQKIRDIRTANGSALTIRSVYMMNCVGSSLNKAWMDAGAKVSSGAIRNNYLPEPTMYFFWGNWKAGQTFENAVTGAYRKTINLMNDAVKTVLGNIPLLSSYAGSINFENFDFVKDSAPVIQGQRSVTVGTDDLSFTQSLYNSLATTVLPVDLLQSLGQTSRSFGTDSSSKPWQISQAGVDWLRKLENISDPQGSAGLIEKIKPTEQAINDVVNVNLSPNQYDALVSFAWNIGPDRLKTSTLLTNLNKGDYDSVPGEIKKWTKGQVADPQALANRRSAEAALFAGAQTSMARSFAEYSRPFYDTGEHAILGEFINNAVSGPLAQTYALQPTTKFSINGVSFTYGQIITMGDFYDNYDDLAKASPTELKGLQALIIRGENHYKNTILGIGGGAVNPDTPDWKGAIGDRYLDLALKNNSHFAPPPAGTSSTKANNKQSWEYYHAKAIAIARKGTSSAALDAAYPVNAFGDHFLTDAFSAGHLINKELVMQKFLANVITGNKVNSAGESLLKKVANGALADKDVKKELGKWEVTETSVLLLGKHPNLDNTTLDIFYRVLKGVLEDTANGGREQIANLAAIAVHDYLNKYNQGTSTPGVPVKNSLGMSWNLSGDGTLNWNKTIHANNLEIIQLAVKQSVVNLEDSVTRSTAPLSEFYQKVWNYVPILTNPDTQAVVSKAIGIFTDPNNSQLVDVAIDLVKSNLKTLIEKLVKAKKVRSIDSSFWG